MGKLRELFNQNHLTKSIFRLKGLVGVELSSGLGRAWPSRPVYTEATGLDSAKLGLVTWLTLISLDGRRWWFDEVAGKIYQFHKSVKTRRKRKMHNAMPTKNLGWAEQWVVA